MKNSWLHPTSNRTVSCVVYDVLCSIYFSQSHWKIKCFWMILFKTKLRCCSFDNYFKKLKILGKSVFIKVMHFMMVQYQDSRKKSTNTQIIVFPIKVFSKWCTFLHLRVTGFILICIIQCWGLYFMELQIPFMDMSLISSSFQ